MPLPTPKSVAPVANTAPVAGAVVETAEKGKIKIKQFGKARTEPDAKGETQQIPAPKPSGVDFVELAKELHAFLKSNIEARKIDFDAFVSSCELDKPSIPGHKEGKATYATANAIVSLDKVFGLLTKERGIGGVAKMKQQLENKSAQMEKLKALLVSLGQSPEAIEAILASQSA